jgi:hypothetical protein
MAKVTAGLRCAPEIRLMEAIEMKIARPFPRAIIIRPTSVSGDEKYNAELIDPIAMKTNMKVAINSAKKS